MTVCYIALGSNLGNRQQRIQNGLHDLSCRPDVAIVRLSPLYETQAVDMPEETPPFLNGVAEARVTCSAFSLLERLLQTETAQGRKRTGKEYASRTIDLDLLLYGNQIIQTPDLVIPHPRMHLREFVLRPLHDLNPHLVIPGLEITVKDALQNVSL
jgi:2-amino-4-hydroxy-6-hydroxymethyldihydropteridine diphosphokinase